MIFSFVLMGALALFGFVNGDYFDDEATVPEFYYDEHAVDIYNNNGNIEVHNGSCFCDTGCYLNAWQTRKCCEVCVQEVTFQLFSRGHATLKATLSVGPSVGRSVGP